MTEPIHPMEETKTITEIRMDPTANPALVTMEIAMEEVAEAAAEIIVVPTAVVTAAAIMMVTTAAIAAIAVEAAALQV